MCYDSSTSTHAHKKATGQPNADRAKAIHICSQCFSSFFCLVGICQRRRTAGGVWLWDFASQTSKCRRGHGVHHSFHRSSDLACIKLEQASSLSDQDESRVNRAGGVTFVDCGEVETSHFQCSKSKLYHVAGGTKSCGDRSPPPIASFWNIFRI